MSPSKYFKDFLIRIIVILLVIFVSSSILGITTVFFVGFFIETVRRIVRIVLSKKSFKINLNYVLWILIQTASYYLALQITKNILLISIIISAINIFIKGTHLEKRTGRFFRHKPKRFKLRNRKDCIKYARRCGYSLPEPSITRKWNVDDFLHYFHKMEHGG